MELRHGLIFMKITFKYKLRKRVPETRSSTAEHSGSHSG